MQNQPVVHQPQQHEGIMLLVLVVLLLYTQQEVEEAPTTPYEAHKGSASY